MLFEVSVLCIVLERACKFTIIPDSVSLLASGATVGSLLYSKVRKTSAKMRCPLRYLDSLSVC
jgi:hypothetical protein